MKRGKWLIQLILFSIVLISLLSFSGLAQIMEDKVIDDVINELTAYVDPALAPVLAELQESKAQLVKDMTSQIKVLIQQRRTGTAEQRESILAEIRSLTKERKNLMKELALKNTKIVRQNKLPSTVLSELPLDISDEIEKDVVERGKLAVYHIDFVDESKSRYVYFLKRDDGSTLSLNFEKDEPALESGTEVIVQGTKVDTAVAVESGKNVEVVEAPVITGEVIGYAEDTFGPQKTLLILIKSEGSSQPFTPEVARNLVFGTVNDFMKENSYGKTTIIGDVAGWYSAPAGVNCGIGFAAYGRDAAQAAGYRLSDYYRFIFAFAGNICEALNWKGLASLGYSQYPSYNWPMPHPYSWAYINIPKGGFSLKWVGHEFGHNLGLYHSNSWDCGNEVIGNTCTWIEYGDVIDIMGKPNAGHFNAPAKRYLRWLAYGSQPDIKTVTTSGTYTIEPYETTSITFPKALRVRLGEVGYGQWYYIEKRAPIGFDSFLSSNTNFLNGVVIHKGADLTDDRFLLDMTPETASWNDAALPVGRSYVDSTTGITITTISAEPNGNAVVQIQFGGGTGTCTTNNPSISISPTTQTGTAGQTLTYSVTIQNNNVGCSASTFIVTPTLPTGWTQSPLTLSETLTSGQSVTRNVQITSASNAAQGTYSISEAVSTGLSVSSTATSTYTVTSTTGTFTDDFNRADSDNIGSSWTEAIGNFIISNQQLKNGVSTSAIHRAVTTSFNAGDATLRADFTANDYRVGPRFGLILRYQNEKNYYLFYRLVGGTANTNKMRISKVVNGREIILSNVAAPKPTIGAPFTIEARAQGSSLSLYLNGQNYGDAIDNSFTSGKAGIYIKRGSRLASHAVDNFYAASYAQALGTEALSTSEIDEFEEEETNIAGQAVRAIKFKFADWLYAVADFLSR